MRIRSYTIHWKRFSLAAVVYAIWILNYVPRGSQWIVANLVMVLLLLFSVQREHQGFGDEWPQEDGDYLRFYGGPLAGRPVRVRGELVAREICDTATMLLPVITDPDGEYRLNRTLKRYDWVARSAAKSMSPSD